MSQCQKVNSFDFASIWLSSLFLMLIFSFITKYKATTKNTPHEFILVVVAVVPDVKMAKKITSNRIA